MLTVPRISSALATEVIETFFYGSRGMRRERSIWFSPILIGGSILFVTVTGHWILTIDWLFLAFVEVDGGANPLQFYGDLSQATQIIQSSLLLASLTTVDALFVRLFGLYDSNIFNCFSGSPPMDCLETQPLCHGFLTLTLLGLIVNAIGVMYDFSQFTPEDDILVFANGWIVADCTFTFLTNIHSLIAWRLWRIQRIIKPTGGRTFMSVIAIVVESAALSASWAIFFVITYVLRSNLRFLIDVTPAIVRSANMLIYVRVGLWWAYAPADTSRTSKPIRSNAPKLGKFRSTSIDEYDEERGKKQVSLVWCVVATLF
ncbi:hypothetical protein B0H19DRAFT_1262290 [Mycena capillaripes]|nr:hypothetical protein B0H19DRAFT_1262290 [Mycena capillaripes]